MLPKYIKSNLQNYKKITKQAKNLLTIVLTDRAELFQLINYKYTWLWHTNAKKDRKYETNS